jgi:hypothetical protein
MSDTAATGVIHVLDIPHQNAEERRFLPGIIVQNTERHRGNRRNVGSRIPHQEAEKTVVCRA